MSLPLLLRSGLTIPNAVSLLRLALVPVFVLLSVRGEFKLALAVFLAAALTDALDGYLARKLNQRSQLGAVLDPAADKIMMVFGFLTYTLHSAILYPLPAWLTFVIFARDVTIVFFAYLLYTRIQVRRFPPSLAGKISTVTQAVTLALIVFLNAFPQSGQQLAPWLFRAALLITLYSAADYVRKGEVMLRRGLGSSSLPDGAGS